MHSQRSNEFFQAYAALPQNILQSLRQNGAVIGNSDMKARLAHADMRAFLPGYREAEPSQCLYGFPAGDIAGKFHTVVKTGSCTKCRRMERGALPSSK